MKIKNISCTQFAGIRDKHISFEDGINIICGKNETGKSTIVNLISRILFQNTQLDRRKDKDFLELYFPGARKGSSVKGDFADGKITFETENGVYTLSKEWGLDGRATFSTPDGIIRDETTINELLKEALLYGEGIYSDMLFSSQKNTDVSLQTILDTSKKNETKQEITDAISLAFAESDGISADAIEQAITAKIDELAGKHWDFEHDTPIRKAGRWGTGLGDVLKAYYALEDANAVLQEILQLETEADQAAKNYTEKYSSVKAAEKAYDNFSLHARRLVAQSERKKSIERLSRELAKIKDDLAKWPKTLKDLENAQRLNIEQTTRNLLDKYESAKEIVSDIEIMKKEFVTLICPTESEIMSVKKAQSQILQLENKLCGMNLNMAAELFNGNTLEITSLRTGENIKITNDNAAITEAVQISIPGVIKMRLSPTDVDVESIEAQIAEKKTYIADIFNRYKVDSIEKLEELAKHIYELESKITAANNRLQSVLGATSYEELESSIKNITAPVRLKQDIDNDILNICDNNNISRFIAVQETIIDSYVAEYGSIETLNAKNSELSAELNKMKQSISDAEDIPEEYLNISDPEAYINQLQEDLKCKQNLREVALTAKTATASKLEGFRESISCDPVEELEKTERIFEEKKSLLHHWLHIKEVFKKQTESIHNNPMDDIAEHFTHYLGVISEDKISSEFIDSDKLNMNIYSDNKLLDYNKLSEGTKETVSLAFRLAILEHLFPDGGGVLVLDDPFTDMDEERTRQACELIKECAKKHQVIFLTCREDYLHLLNGNNIKI